MRPHLELHPVYHSVAGQCAALDLAQALAAEEFPSALWRELAKRGVLAFTPASISPPDTAPAGVALDPASPGSWHALAVAGYSLTRLSRNLGLTIS